MHYIQVKFQYFHLTRKQTNTHAHTRKNNFQNYFPEANFSLYIHTNIFSVRFSIQFMSVLSFAADHLLRIQKASH